MFIRIDNDIKSHNVLVDSIDYSAICFNRYFFSDPDGSDQRTLQDSFERRITAKSYTITVKYILS